jgi:hypothetical protein
MARRGRISSGAFCRAVRAAFLTRRSPLFGVFSTGSAGHYRVVAVNEQLEQARDGRRMSESNVRMNPVRTGPRQATRWWAFCALAGAVILPLAPASSVVPPGAWVGSGAFTDAEAGVPLDLGPVAAATFPTRSSVGLPPGWEPEQEHTGDLWIRTRGTVVEDLRITGGIVYVAAQNVTLRRVHAVDAFVVNDVNGACGSGLVVESSTFVRTSGATETDLPVIGNGGLAIRDVLIDGVPEGIRVGSKHCGGVAVENSYIGVVPPAECQDWHGDGIQGDNGGSLVVRQSTITLEERADCPGNAPFFYPDDQSNTSLAVDGLLVSGGGYPFRAGTSGTVRNLRVVDESWGYGPAEVSCPAVTVTGSHLVTVAANGRTTSVGPLTPCAGGS